MSIVDALFRSRSFLAEVEAQGREADAVIALIHREIPTGSCGACGVETLYNPRRGERSSEPCKACGGGALRPIPTVEYWI